MIQLRIRTEYSFGKTFAPIDRVIERLLELNCTAAGIVDDATWGHVAWFNACIKANIQPLLGVACVVNDDDMALKMWFLAKNTDGLSELYKATSKSYGQTIKLRRGSMPRLYTYDVAQMSDNIFKFAGDVTDGAFLASVDAIIDLNPSSRILNHKKMQVAEQHGLMLVSTSDNNYASEGDKHAFTFISKPSLKVTPQHILKELEYQDNAKTIADLCRGMVLPVAPMVREDGNLEKLCRDGAKFRKMKLNKVYEKRLMYELELIKSKDYESYFIIVADMTRYAKQHMIVGPSRGSAAGSLVCYLSRITEIDPIVNGLYFERFIDVSRSDLPDIDLDFPDKKRHLVFDYMAEKYGINNTAHIGTISKFRPKSALIQVCKALGIPPSETATVKLSIIERSSGDARASECLEDTFDSTEEGRRFIKEYPEVRVAALLEGHASHTGTHAAGLLVCNDEITNYATVDNKGIAHVEKHSAEQLGLLKIDVLGLRTLGILEDSGVDIDWYNLPLDDPAVYEIFNSGRLCGIFQFEGSAMRQVAKQIEMKSIIEIDAVTALARPGPFGGGVTYEYMQRASGKAYKSIHPLVEKHMAETYQLPIYQEQTLTLVREIGQFTWEETANVRKAMSKSLGVEFFQHQGKKFVKGAMKLGIDEQTANEIWDMINAMGAWQMNKAHTRSYATISYWCAYLKAYHPLEFSAANLRNAKDEDSAIQLLREMKHEGESYIAFDFNKSEADWSVQGGQLYGGFMALKGIGPAKAAKFISMRDAGESPTDKQMAAIRNAVNPYKDIFPFHTKYQHLYDEPHKHGIADALSEIADLIKPGAVPHGEERVFLGEMIYKNQRNANEKVNVKKRDGKRLSGPLDYLDVRFRDDHGVIGGRIGRFDFERIGHGLLERTPMGAHIMVRAKFFHDIPWAFITRWKRIDDGE